MKSSLFLEKNIRKLFFKIAIPGAVGMLASAIYQIIDGVLVNAFLGNEAFAALNFAMPLVIILYAISDLIGVGSSVIIAVKMGEGKQKEANGIFSSSLLTILILNSILGLTTFFASDSLLSLFGAEGELLSLASQYLKVYALSIPVGGFIFALDNYLRIASKVKMSLVVNILMSVSVMGLESLFLGVLGLPIYGAALATSICFCFYAIVSFIPFLSSSCTLKLGKPIFNFCLEMAIIKNGLPTFLANISGRITSIIINAVLLMEAGEDAVSVYGVLMYIDGFVQPLLYGMSDSLQPCLGYNYGAKEYGRVKKLAAMCFLANLIVCLFSFFILIAFPSSISGIFLSGGSDSLMEMAKTATILFAFTYLSRWFNYTSQGFFQAIEKTLPSILISLSISLIFPLISLLSLWEVGLNGIWLNVPISSLCASLLSLFFLYIYIGKRKLLDPKVSSSLV